MSRQTIKALFIQRYADLRNRLSYRLGSDDLAEDVLQETWLRVDQMAEVSGVQNPLGYLFRMALNVAADQRKAQSRLLYYTEIEELMQSTDDALDPASAAGALREVEQLQRALYKLPSRRRAILLASRVEGVPHRDIAARFGVSTRTVEKELKVALLYCGDWLDREVMQRFGPGAGKPSTWETQAPTDDDAHDERD
jgi:RNA polymerase sigma factor (sigma-70 family)